MIRRQTTSCDDDAAVARLRRRLRRWQPGPQPDHFTAADVSRAISQLRPRTVRREPGLALIDIAHWRRHVMC